MSDKEKDKVDDADRDEESPRDDADDSDEDKREESSEAEREDGDDDGSAARVAEALGVDDGEAKKEEGEEAEGEEAKEEEVAAAPNRAARRREEALERRRKRKGLPAKKEGEDRPKDKNKRAKELLQRRRESAASGESRPAQLEAGEMVDDALTRMWASTTKWLRKNLTAVQWVIAVGLLAVGGFTLYTYLTEKKAGAASSLLASGARAERGTIAEEDKRADEEREVDPTPIFKTPEERADKALAGYRDVQKQYPGTGTAILAQLGEAGVLLDKREYDPAIAAFEAVLKTPLAAADPDVKGRAIEGLGLAKEGKGEADGAMTEFRRLESIDARGYKELSQYHQARLLLSKNTDDDRAKAKDLLKTAYDKLKEPGLDKKPTVYLEKSIEQLLRTIDPTLVPDRDTLGGVRGNQMSNEEMQAKIRKMLEDQGKKQGDGDGH